MAAIALVHETLSRSFEETVDFDEVADRLRTMVVEVSSSVASEQGRVESQRCGSFGTLRADLATSLSMVLVELLQNAVQHGLAGDPGRLRLVVSRDAGTLDVRVDDDGRGLPADFDPAGASSLGITIVRTLVESELGGRISLGALAPGSDRPGTTATVRIPLTQSSAPGTVR